MDRRHVVIVGGGISGLSTAYFLSRRAALENHPIKISVLEASDRFGGVLRTFSFGGFSVEAGADAFYAGRHDATELCRDLGLQDELMEAAPCFRRFFIFKNKKYFPAPLFPHSLFDGMLFLKSSGLSFSAKGRMILEPFIPSRQGDEDESVGSFLCRRLGRGFYQNAAAPLIRGVYMADPMRLSLEATFPHWRHLEKKQGSLAASFWNKDNKKRTKRSPEFFSLKNGLEELIRVLIRELEGCDLRKRTPVQECVYDKSWQLKLEGGEMLRADVLCLAMNACDSAKWISRTAPELSRELAAIRHDSFAVVNLIYRGEDIPRQVPDSGFLVPAAGEQYPFSSLKWFFKKEAGAGSADGEFVCFKAFISEAMLPGIFCRDDEKIGQGVRIFLEELWGVRVVPRFASVERYSDALPQYETGHLERVKRIEERLRCYPGLHLAGNGFRGFGITDCIHQAKVTAFQL